MPTRNRVAQGVRVIFSTSAGLMDAYLARMRALAGLVALLVGPHRRRLDGIAKPRGEIRIDVRAGDGDRQEAVFGAHRIEGQSDTACSTLQCQGRLGLGKNGGVEVPAEQRRYGPRSTELTATRGESRRMSSPSSVARRTASARDAAPSFR